MTSSTFLDAFNAHMLEAAALQKVVDDAKKPLDAALKEARREMERYITNKSLPLTERWEFFMNAPASLKNHLPSIYTPRSKSFESLIAEILESDRRRSTYDTSDMLEGVAEPFQDNPDTHFWWDEKKYRVADALEEVLAKNLGSFVLDW